MDTYLNEIANWKPIIKLKSSPIDILLDSDIIISLLQYNSTQVLRELRENGNNLCTINSVLLELFATNSSEEYTKRFKLLQDENVHTLPIEEKILKNARDIQSFLISRKISPSIVDLYLGGSLAKYSTDSLLLLTANLKDFPSPLYLRKAHILLQNDKSCKVFTFLSINRELLKTIENISH